MNRPINQQELKLLTEMVEEDKKHRAAMQFGFTDVIWIVAGVAFVVFFIMLRVRIEAVCH